MTTSVRIEAAGEEHMPAVQAIYAHYVLHDLASFEEVPPDLAEMRARRAAVLAMGLPYLVAIAGDRVIGYAYAGSYRARSAYRFTIENSVYVSAEHQQRGTGRRLLETLIARCEGGPYRQMVAVIGNSGNTGSIRLHESLGFAHVGVLRDVGYKFGQWVDTVIMQRSLR